MKKLRPYCLLAAGLLGSLSAWSQTTPAPAVLGAAGQAFQANGLVLDWTVGERAVVAWQQAGTAQVLEGFHRGAWAPAATAFEDLAVYPNPFKTEVWVRVPATTPAVQLEIYDLQGRQLRTLTQTPELGHVRLDLADLPVASYVLSVFDPATHRRTTHFILKNE
ncbi:T9SS type A sorting domain-containing protein [uncultured Hymenobacter sp.]|uniref:T9SS type A sorting domain-containing protein n=1 Tax=uncultured Hymenobacter sp. TaxID=170016 RepID=UPI0035CB6351